MALTDFDAPLSNVEAILQNALGAENEVVPQSRVEELLDRLDKTLEDMDIGTQIDSAISGTSENPVQNKVIKTALDAKADANAVVTSVNGSTGAVIIGTATTQANGLMSSTDKDRLDTLYADYSSALTALGVS